MYPESNDIPEYKYMKDDDSILPLIIGLVITVIIVLGGLGYFMGWYDLNEQPNPTKYENTISEEEQVIQRKLMNALGEKITIDGQEYGIVDIHQGEKKLILNNGVKMRLEAYEKLKLGY